MEVFELRYPGAWLDGVPDEAKVQVLLSELETQLADASIGLASFKASIARPQPEPGWRRRQARSRAITAEMKQQLPGDLTPEQRFNAERSIPETADLKARREEWAQGHVPESYQRRLPFIYAHTVLYALDAIGKTLDVLTNMGLPPGITSARDAYRSALPYLVDVRDSAHHKEDRARGFDRQHRPLNLRPISNRMINAPGGTLVLSGLNSNLLGYTASDGHYREVEISSTSVSAAQSAIQQALDALPWTGPVRTTPF